MTARRVWLIIAILFFVCLSLSPIIYLKINDRRERAVLNVHLSATGLFDLYSTQPTVMDYNSSRIVAFTLKANKALSTLISFEDGKMYFKGSLSAPGFDVSPMQTQLQPATGENSWSFVLVPRRSGKQLAMFNLKWVLSDDANHYQKALFKLWMDKLPEKFDKMTSDSPLTDDIATIEVIQPWLNLETIVQIVGIIGGIVTTLNLLKTTFFQKNQPDPIAPGSDA